jgi:hypothetical protein
MFAVMLFLSWKSFKGECPLSYLEKTYIDKNYKLGQDILSHPYVDIVVEKNKEKAWVVLGVQINLVFVYVVIRYTLNNITNFYARYFIIGLAITIFLKHFSYTVNCFKSLMLKESK